MKREENFRIHRAGALPVRYSIFSFRATRATFASRIRRTAYDSVMALRTFATYRSRDSRSFFFFVLSNAYAASARVPLHVLRIFAR